MRPGGTNSESKIEVHETYIVCEAYIGSVYRANMSIAESLIIAMPTSDYARLVDMRCTDPDLHSTWPIVTHKCKQCSAVTCGIVGCTRRHREQCNRIALHVRRVGSGVSCKINFDL